MTVSSPSRAERRLLRRLHSAELGRLAAGDERFFDRHPGRRTRLRFAGQAEIATASGTDADALLNSVPGIRAAVAVRRIAPGITVKIMFPGWEREDVDVPEREAAATFDLLSGTVPGDVRVITADLMEHAAKRGSAS